MEWKDYEASYTVEAELNGMSIEHIEKNLKYAKKLFDNNVPIIYDQYHFSYLVGISYEYIFKITNSSKSGYRKFNIQKKNGGIRTINEPLPNLKVIQKWILEKILERVSVSPYAKAYKKTLSIKDNVRFHRNQKKVLRLDITDFFGHLRQRKVLSIFLNLGYSLELSVMLAKLCTLHHKLPQGAPTSAYLSNLLMVGFDKEISLYCSKKKIRYTRYADDMTFSGDFNEYKLISKVKNTLGWLGLYLNKDKTHLMRQHDRQLVTGITVNEKIQVQRNVRRTLRKEIYFIEKYGIESHLEFLKLKIDSDLYLKSLLGKLGYCVFINPKDEEFQQYYNYIEKLMREK